MGQKVHPRANRLAIIYSWDSKWFSKENYRQMLLEDIVIRETIEKEAQAAGISRVEIDKTPNHIHIKIICGRPGVIIGRSGAGVDQLRSKIEENLKKLTAGQDTRQMNVSVEEVPGFDLDARLLAQNIASQLEKRVAYRRAMKQAISRALRAGALGVKAEVSGRLVGANMARREWYMEGKVPLHTFSADVDYGFAEARTKYGQIGVKVWVNREVKKEES